MCVRVVRGPGVEVSSCPGGTGGNWMELRGKKSFIYLFFFVDETLMKDWNNDELNCVFFFGLSHLQSQFCHMEPTQNDVCPSAVFSPAGQRGGEATSLTSSSVHTPIQGLKSVLLFVVLFLDRV